MPEEFYEQAIAFLQAATLLCEAAGQAGQALQWSEGSVCYYCLNIATELFLKTCIQKAKPAVIIPPHEISELIRTYREILPEGEFQFVTLWDRSWTEIEKDLGVKIVATIDHHPDQLFRYGVDRSGKGSAGRQHFCPDYFYGYVTYLNDVWKRAWNKVSNAETMI